MRVKIYNANSAPEFNYHINHLPAGPMSIGQMVRDLNLKVEYYGNTDKLQKVCDLQNWYETNGEERNIFTTHLHFVVDDAGEAYQYVEVGQLPPHHFAIRGIGVDITQHWICFHYLNTPTHLHVA